MLKVCGVMFLIFALIYIVTIVFVVNLIKGICEDFENEQLKLIQEKINNENKIRDIKFKLKDLRSKQLYGNTNLVINAVEKILNKKELSATDQSVR